MYDYKNNRNFVFTEEGQAVFLKIRDNINTLIGMSGAIRMCEAISVACGEVWHLMACVDRLIELGEIKEVTSKEITRRQDRIFVKT